MVGQTGDFPVGFKRALDQGDAPLDEDLDEDVPREDGENTAVAAVGEAVGLLNLGLKALADGGQLLLAGVNPFEPQQSRTLDCRRERLLTFDQCKSKPKSDEVIPTSIQDHIWLDVAGCQCRKKLGEEEGKCIIIPSMLLVQMMVKVQSVVETAAINNQATVPKPHILEEVSVPFHKGGETLDPHEPLVFMSIQTESKFQMNDLPRRCLWRSSAQFI